MPSCLGIYLEKNIIKYAKLSKDHDIVKVDSFGMKFYDKLNEAISQIIAETNSHKTPVSINLSEEQYNYFHIFSLLNKNDINSAIQTEFESVCFEKGINKNALETRYALVPSTTDKEKVKVIHSHTNKSEINRILQEFDGNKIGNISSLPISIVNLINKEEKNIAIINIEEKTEITTIIDNNINNIEIIDEGIKEILDGINSKENSYSKAYNICKNTTIYTSTTEGLESETNEYLEDIMPTLYNIVGYVRKITNEDMNKIEKIYITGSGAMINNIDLYFGEYLTDIKCEVLKPYFVDSSSAKVNVKDYIEVNSAIAMAMQGLGFGIDGMNFKKTSFLESLPDWAKIEVGGAKKLNKGSSKGNKFDFSLNLGEKLDNIEKYLSRTAGAFLLLVIIYITISSILTSQLFKKEKEVDELIEDTNYQMSLLSADLSKTNDKTSKYNEMIDSLNKMNEAVNERYQTKEAIPNLLNQIMYIIPKNVQVTSVENTVGRHIQIKVQAEKYEQLGYFKAQLKNDQVLRDIVSDQGVKENNLVKITIEGELP